jgi:4-alpha-glucanotransferase
MDQAPSTSDKISVSFDKFITLVDARFSAIAGLSINDVEDFDFWAYYPGEEATKKEYVDAAKDAASACLANAAGEDAAAAIEDGL